MKIKQNYSYFRYCWWKDWFQFES